jgi:tetratricopeptide (TPR) repeat protein
VAWNLGLLAYAPWPAILLGTELRRVRSSRALRQELARAERDVGRRDYAQSLAAYDRAIELTRKGTSGEDLPWYGKGATLVLLGRYEDALRAIDRALDINPYNEVAWLNKGNALMRLGRHTDALRCFNAALRVNPRYEVAWNNKGNALARMGRYEEALRCYEKALTIDPRYRGSWVNKGYVLTKLGRYKEAASCADRALRLERRRSEPA